MALTNQEIKDGIIFKKVAGTWGIFIKDSVREEFRSAEVEIEVNRNDNWSYCEDLIYKGVRFCKDAANRYGICNDNAREMVHRDEHSHVIDLKGVIDDNPNNAGISLIKWSIDNASVNISSSFNRNDQIPRGSESDDINLDNRTTFYPFVNLHGVSGPGENEGNEFSYQEYPKGRDNRKKPKIVGDQDQTTRFPKLLEFFDGSGDDPNCTMYLDSPNFKVKKETSLTKLKIKTRSGNYKGRDIPNNAKTIITRTIDSTVNFYDLQYEGNNGKNNGKPQKAGNDDKQLVMYDGCAEAGEYGAANVVIKIRRISNIDRVELTPPEPGPEPVIPDPPPEPDPPPPVEICIKSLTIDFPDGNDFVADAGSPGISVRAIARGVHTDGCLWTWTELGGDEVASDYAANVQTLDFPTTCGQSKIYTVRADWVDEVCTLDDTASVTLSSRACPAPDPLCEKTLDITIDKPRTVGNPGDTVVVKALADGVNTDGCVWTWTEVGGDVLASGGGENQQTLPMPSSCGQEKVWNVTATFDDTGTDPPGACVLSATKQVRTLTESCPPPEPPAPPEPVIELVYVGGPCPTSSDWDNDWPSNYNPSCPVGPSADRTEESLGGLILRRNPRDKQKLILSFGSLEGAQNPLRQKLGLSELDEDKSLANKLITIKVEWKRNANWAQRFRATASCSDIKEGDSYQSAGSPYSRPGIDYSTAASSSPSNTHDKDFIIYNIDGSSTVAFHHTSTPGDAPTRNYFSGETITVSDSAPDETQDPPVITRTYTTTCEPPGGITESYTPWPPCGAEVYVTKSGGTTAEAVYSDGAPDGPNGDQSIKITLLAIRESVIDHSKDEIDMGEELEKSVWLASTTPASAENFNDVQGWSLADYHEHSDKARFRNPALRTSITDIDLGGTKMSEFVGVAGALFPGTIDQLIVGKSLPINISKS